MATKHEPSSRDVTHDAARKRYELSAFGQTAFAEYERRDHTLIFTHTVVPDAIGGRGVGTELVRGALDSARAQNLKIVARCSFVAEFVRRHPEYAELVDRSA